MRVSEPVQDFGVRWQTYLHPPFFSMLFSHLGQVRVFALIHCDVPASSRAFLSHILTNLQTNGR